MKNYTGNKEVFVKIKNYLLDKGFKVKNAIHIGKDKYEFEEDFQSFGLGIHSIHKILAWIENEEVIYKTEVIGMMACD
jgi:hypothetical protein